MTELLKDSGIYAIPVAKDYFDFRFHYSSLYDEWVLYYKSKTIWERYRTESCNWKVCFEKEPVIICTSASATEADAARVVGNVVVWREFWYKDYESQNDDPYEFETATDSLSSLLRSLNLNEPNYLIIKKNNA